MKARTILTLLVSLVLAGVAALVANTWITQRLGATDREDQTTRVIAAAADIPVGRKIEATDVKAIAIPEGSLQPGNITQVEDVLGRVATQPLYEGEILVKKRLTDPVGGSPLAAVIEEGKRAITVRVNDVIGVAGFLLPGSRVDVVATRRGGGARETRSTTILQNIKVLAVDQTASSDKDDPVIVRAVTLEVAPQEAEKIVKATEEGHVQLTLRNPLDQDELGPEPVAGAPAPKPKPARRWSGYQVDVIRGTEVSRTSVRN
jgi:pilus assembly protein CpaB